ncbi:hypothetical protein [Paenibacillus farraposensis]|uniref:hypothetical protein n=1 Tax=Paenibacillus farraposensis TaxID=2807095 RepID=UPI00366D2F35
MPRSRPLLAYGAPTLSACVSQFTAPGGCRFSAGSFLNATGAVTHHAHRFY